MKGERKQGTQEIRTTLAVVLNTMENIRADIDEIKHGIKAINGGLRSNQQDVARIETRCVGCKDDINELKRRMNVFSTLAAVSGGILGYFGSYFK